MHFLGEMKYMKRYILENDHILIEFINLGGCITKMIKKSSGTNYVIALDDRENYKSNPYYLGAIIGRNAGRTYPSTYTNYLNEHIVLDRNENTIHLHGGYQGLQHQLWTVDQIDHQNYELTYSDTHSVYEEMNFKIIYKLVDDTFKIELFGKSKVPTICNLTNHTYFNLNRDKAQPINTHFLRTAPAEIQLINEKLVPTGEYSDMKNAYQSFDFTEIGRVDKAFEGRNELLRYSSGGINLAYRFLDSKSSDKILLTNDTGENKLLIQSNQDSCVIYTLNVISEDLSINGGIPITKFGGITFEMQRVPNYVHLEDDVLVNDYYSFTEYKIF